MPQSVIVAPPLNALGVFKVGILISERNLTATRSAGRVGTLHPWQDSEVISLLFLLPGYFPTG